jgi:hypothetical protein
MQWKLSPYNEKIIPTIRYNLISKETRLNHKGFAPTHRHSPSTTNSIRINTNSISIEEIDLHNTQSTANKKMISSKEKMVSINLDLLPRIIRSPQQCSPSGNLNEFPTKWLGWNISPPNHDHLGWNLSPPKPIQTRVFSKPQRLQDLSKSNQKYHPHNERISSHCTFIPLFLFFLFK